MGIAGDGTFKDFSLRACEVRQGVAVYHQMGITGDSVYVNNAYLMYYTMPPVRFGSNVADLGPDMTECTWTGTASVSSSGPSMTILSLGSTAEKHQFYDVRRLPSVLDTSLIDGGLVGFRASANVSSGTARILVSSFASHTATTGAILVRASQCSTLGLCMSLTRLPSGTRRVRLTFEVAGGSAVTNIQAVFQQMSTATPSLSAERSLSRQRTSSRHTRSLSASVTAMMSISTSVPVSISYSASIVMSRTTSATPLPPRSQTYTHGTESLTTITVTRNSTRSGISSRTPTTSLSQLPTATTAVSPTATAMPQPTADPSSTASPSLSPSVTVLSSRTHSAAATRSPGKTASLLPTPSLDAPRPAAVPAPTLPPAAETIAVATATAGGVVAAFVGAGVTGTTQAGRTLAILQLVACSDGSDPESSDSRASSSPGESAAFPQALLPWLKVGAGQAGWDRGVVLGNAFAVALVLIVGTCIWAAVSKAVALVAARKPGSWAARLGTSPDEDAPSEANAAAVRVARLLRFPGSVLTMAVGFAVDGFVGEAVTLIRHGIEGRAEATPVDVALGFAALGSAAFLWAAYLYVSLVVVPRNVTATLPLAGSALSPGNGALGSTGSVSSRVAAVNRSLRGLRDGNCTWAVIPVSGVGFPQRLEAIDRHVFAARWAVLFAPLRPAALFFPAVDIAASVAVAAARGLRPRTADGCQRALVAVAAVQVALLAVVVVLRPFLAPLKTAVTAVATALLSLSAVVGAAASFVSGDKTTLAIAAGYIAAAAGAVLLANPVMAAWRVVDARMAARSKNRPPAMPVDLDHIDDVDAPLLDQHDHRSGSDTESSTFSFEMQDLPAPTDLDASLLLDPLLAADDMGNAPADSSANEPSNDTAGIDVVDAVFDLDGHDLGDLHAGRTAVVEPARDDEQPPLPDVKVVVEKEGEGAVLAAELEAMLSSTRVPDRPRYSVSS